MQPTPPPPPAPPPVPGVRLVRPDPDDPTVFAVEGGTAAVAGGEGARAAPRTVQDLAGLREQRRELSDQLVSAQDRRKDVARALENAHDPVNQNGLQARLKVLDARIAQLETDVAETGRLITSASPSLAAPPDLRDGRFGGELGPPKTAVAIVFILFVLFPMVIMIGRSARRRPIVATPDPAAREAAERLGRLEQAVDAIAVEVERVSEGQRFVTQLLAESRQAPSLARPEDTLDVVGRQG